MKPAADCPECHGVGYTIVPSCMDDPRWPCDTCYPRRRPDRGEAVNRDLSDRQYMAIFAGAFTLLVALAAGLYGIWLAVAP